METALCGLTPIYHLYALKIGVIGNIKCNQHKMIDGRYGRNLPIGKGWWFALGCQSGTFGRVPVSGLFIIGQHGDCPDNMLQISFYGRAPS